MPRKKKEELEAEGTQAETSQNETAEETSVEVVSAENAESQVAEVAAEDKPKRTKKAKTENVEAGAGEETSVISSVFETVSSVVGNVAEAVTSGVSTVVSAVSDLTTTDDADNKTQVRKRAEKIGVVSSDKMTKTVVVRVDRVVKHPVYRKYVKRRNKFMAHDEKGATIGDKVRIVETRPMSARKRWRVVEIIQKAEK